MVDCIAPLYLPASYNGVFFEGLVASSEHGRRGVTGEFPFGEQTRFQDLGIKIRKYSLSGRFQGPDCVAQTSILIAAVETPGPGTLIHPTRGVLTVSCSSFKVKDDLVQSAGETTFDMEFVDASGGEVGLGSFAIIPVIADVISAVVGSFNDNYDPSGLLFFQKTVVQNTTQQMLADLAAAFYTIIPGNADDQTYQTLAQIQAAATNFDTWLTSAGTANAVTFAFAAIDSYSIDPQVEYITFRTLANKYALSATSKGLAGICQEACYTLMRCLSAAYMMRSATQIPNLKLNDALSNLDQTAALVFQEKLNAVSLGDDNLYLALAAFQAIVLRTLSQYAYNLPPSIIYKYAGGIGSLVAAYDIYGDSSKFEDLEKQNPNNFPFALGPTIIASQVPKFV